MRRTTTLVTSTILVQSLSLGCAGQPAGIPELSTSPTEGEPAAPGGVATATATPEAPPTSVGVTPAPGLELRTDKSAYAYAETVVVTFSGLAGNAQERLAVAPAGSPGISGDDWLHRVGASAGTIEFFDPPEGEALVIRAFDALGHVIGESAPFSVALQSASVVTDKSSYLPSETIQVTYAGGSHGARDYVSIARVGAAVEDRLQYQFTGKLTAGTIPLSLDGKRGRFVARVHRYGKESPVAESAPFTITSGAAVTLAKTSFAYGEPVQVSFSGFKGVAKDWVGVSSVGVAPRNYADYAYVSGSSGSASFPYLMSGTFVARAYFDDSYELEAESEPFDVGVVPPLPMTVTTDKAVYTGFEDVTVSYAGMEGNATDWVGLFRPDASMWKIEDWQYTSGQTSGAVVFSNLFFGDYDTRTAWNDGYELKGRSARFSVVAVVAPEKSTFAVGEAITVSFGGMLGDADDFVALAKSDALPTYYDATAPTNAAARGSVLFATPPSQPGSYVARAYFAGAKVVKAASAPFTIAGP